MSTHRSVNRNQFVTVYGLVCGHAFKVTINYNKKYPIVKIGKDLNADFHSFYIKNVNDNIILNFKNKDYTSNLYNNNSIDLEISYSSDKVLENDIQLPEWIVSFEIIDLDSSKYDYTINNKIIDNTGNTFIEFVPKKNTSF